jgi:RNA recognition motif-containing protein
MRFYIDISGGGGGGGSSSNSGGGYGFRRDRDSDREVEIQKDAIYIQDLPKDVTRDQIQDAFSTVGTIKVNIYLTSTRFFIEQM